MTEQTLTTQPQSSFRTYLTPVVVIVVNGIVLGRHLNNWRNTWNLVGPDRPFTGLIASFGPVDWFFLLVPVAGITFELARSKWSGIVNVLGHLSVFLWLLLALILASTNTLGFSGPEHVFLAVILEGLPALGISAIFAWLFRRVGRLRPSSVTSAGT